MDQLKDILRQAIKYRFWIVVGIAAILPMIAYFAAAGPIKQKATEGANNVKSASEGIKQFVSGTFPNGEWKSLTEQRTAVLSQDVLTAWRLLYNQQAPLLTWPPEVESKFKEWGITAWPVDASGNPIDDSLIQETVNDYVLVYPQYVDKVYKSFRPFDYETGEGIVAAPAKEALLRPATYNAAKPPTYGKVVAAQQKLWIQSTVLDVVNQVNGSVTSWDTAPLKQILAMEVANAKAQDQRSIAEGETLEKAPEIAKPGSETAESESGTGTSGSSDMSSAYAAYSSSSRGSGMGGQSVAPEEVYFLTSATPESSYRIAPVYVAVLIDQARMLEVFDKFKQSPMAIQVVDFELKRPASRVQKPVKGENNPLNGYGGMGGSSYILGMGGSGYGAYGSGMGSGAAGYAEMMKSQMGGYGSYGGGGMMGGPTVPEKKGVDVRKEKLDREKKAKEDAKKAEDAKANTKQDNSVSDPYFNIVELHIYGQARFYNPPPPEEPASTSESVTSEETEATPDAAKAEPAAKAEAEQPADAPKAEANKTEGAPATEAAPVPETPNDAAPAGAAPKAESEPPKAEDTPAPK